MTEFSERHLLILGDHFSSRIVTAASVATLLTKILAAQQATWEPHDWEDFS